MNYVCNKLFINILFYLKYIVRITNELVNETRYHSFFFKNIIKAYNKHTTIL